jgi:acetyl esterase/lipase
MLIITGEHDRIRDPAEVYGNRLQLAGVRVTMKRYKSEFLFF